MRRAKLAWSCARTHRQVFNFYRLAVYELRRYVGAAAGATFCVAGYDVSRVARVCNINKFTVKTCPRRTISEGSARPRRENGECARTTLSQVQHRYQQTRAETFNALQTWSGRANSTKLQIEKEEERVRELRLCDIYISGIALMGLLLYQGKLTITNI